MKKSSLQRLVEMEKKVSIVIPVYNVKDYLEEAVSSAITQTYRNLEIILVDDGSTDGSGRMCDALKEKDDRIIVIHDKNEGLSEARNRGIRIATGEYICFLDSDDYLDVTFVEKLAASMETTGADLAICPLWKIYPDGEKTGPKPEAKYIELSKDETYKLIFTNSGHIGLYTPNKLYRRALFDSVSFPYGKYYEDSGTTYRIIQQCDKCVYYSEPLYFYRANRPNSILSDKSKLNRRFDKCDFLEEMDSFFRTQDKDVYSAFLSKYTSDLMGILEDCFNQAETGSLLWNRAKGMFLKHRKEILSNRYIPAGRKLKGICLMLGNSFFSIYCVLKKLLYAKTSFRGYEG